MLGRRNFLKSAASVAALSVSTLPACADPLAFSDHGDWRAYEIRTIVEIDSTEPTQVWVPAASFADPLWSRPLGTEWIGNSSAELVRDPAYGAEIVKLEWRGGGERRAEIVSRVATRGRSVPLAAGSHAASLSAEERALYLKATALIPTGGVVKETSDKIVAGAATDIAKASAIYAWLVASTGASSGPVGFLMYPDGEVGGLQLDCLDPAAFRYRIEAREISI